MNKTLGSTLLVSGTMIGAGMLAMPLTAAGIGFTATIVLLFALWALLTYTALLFTEAYQTVEATAGIGTLAEIYFGGVGRVISTVALFVFLYALLAAYVTGGGDILGHVLPQFSIDRHTNAKISILIFTILFGTPVIIGTGIADYVNRILFFVMLAALGVVLLLMVANIKTVNLLAMPIDKFLIVSASPVFFTSFGFHGSIPSLNTYLGKYDNKGEFISNTKSLRIAILCGSLITLIGYIVWQFSTHGVLTQGEFLKILESEPNLGGLVKATEAITGSTKIAGTVQLFSALALITSFIGVSLGLVECVEDLFNNAFRIKIDGRFLFAMCTFLPPLGFALFYPEGFIKALAYAGQIFAFYAVVIPVLLVWKVRRQYPNLPYRVAGGNVILWFVLILGVIISCIPFLITAGYLPAVVG